MRMNLNHSNPVHQKIKFNRQITSKFFESTPNTPKVQNDFQEDSTCKGSIHINHTHFKQRNSLSNKPPIPPSSSRSYHQYQNKKKQQQKFTDDIFYIPHSSCHRKDRTQSIKRENGYDYLKNYINTLISENLALVNQLERKDKKIELLQTQLIQANQKYDALLKMYEKKIDTNEYLESYLKNEFRRKQKSQQSLESTLHRKNNRSIKRQDSKQKQQMLRNIQKKLQKINIPYSKNSSSKSLRKQKS